MAGWSVSERRLASGASVRVVRIACSGFEVIPAFDAPAPEAETRISQVLNAARLEVPLRPVPPPAMRLAIPAPPDAEGVVDLSQRRRAEDPEVAMLAPLRLLRLMAADIGADQVLVNGNYFLFAAQELTRRFDALGDPIGLVVAGGIVLNPPLHPRACIAMGQHGAQVLHIGFDAITVRGADGRIYRPHAPGPAAEHGPGRAYAEGFGTTRARPPAVKGLWDVAVCGRDPVAFGPAGAVDVPRAGAVLRCESHAAAQHLAAGPVTYDLGIHLYHAVQAGPQVVAGGRCLSDARNVFEAERMAPGGHWPMVSPHGWPADWDETRAARLGAGVTAAGDLLFWLIEGTSSSLRGGTAAAGASLRDLSALMREDGAIEGVHLDGGGSAQGFVQGGGALVRSGEIHKGLGPGIGYGLGSAGFERPLPLGLLLR